MSYALIKKVSTPYEKTIVLAKEALQGQGFGVLSEIDIAATLKKRLGIDTPRTLILGACNPNFANRALTQERNVSVFLPCNVVVRETPGGQVEVAAMNPEIMSSLMDNPAIAEVAKDVAQGIRAALEALK
jgi:uncharacterized protein (DUF302 family)